jgi:hypothetical protein
VINYEFEAEIESTVNQWVISLCCEVLRTHGLVQEHHKHENGTKIHCVVDFVRRSGFQTTRKRSIPETGPVSVFR